LIGNGNDDSDSGDGGEDIYNGKAESMLVSVSDLYSNDDAISVSNSRYSSYPAYTDTDYCPNESVCYFVLRRMFYSKQYFKNDCCSSV